MSAAIKAPSFGQRVQALLTPDQLKALNRVRWSDRLTSPWAPVTVLGLVFLVYLAIVESVVCTYVWLQPLMKALGTLCFFWWAGVLIAGLVLRKWSNLRKTRTIAEEQLAELETLINRNQAKLEPATLDKLTESGKGLVLALSGDEKTLEAAHADFGRLGDKHLASFRRSGVVDFAGGFSKALLIALLVRSVCFEPFKIPSGSMMPTLELGDQIFVNKFIYGVRLPFTNYVPFVLWREPKRGDIIVFENPNDPSKDYIKRVMGVPGDHLKVEERQVTLNGTKLPLQEEGMVTTWERSSEDQLLTWLTTPRTWFINDWRPDPRVISREVLDGTPHLDAHSPSFSGSFDGEIVVPEKSVFVMGDSRDNSSDSRLGLGVPSKGLTFVPFGNIKGKATVIWLALGHGGLLSNIFGGTGIRTDRFFTPVTMCGTEPKRGE